MTDDAPDTLAPVEPATDAPSVPGGPQNDLAAAGPSDVWHDTKGRFAKGNPGGPGNPHIRQIAAYRRAVAEAVTVDDIKAVVLKLLEAAKAGKPWAVELLLDRCLGKATQPVSVDDGQAVKMVMAIDLERV